MRWRRLKGSLRTLAALLLSQHQRAHNETVPFLPDASILFLPIPQKQDFHSFILNTTRGRSLNDLSFSVAYRHYLKRIKIAVVENLSASKLVLLAECIIYRLRRIRRTAIFLIRISLTPIIHLPDFMVIGSVHNIRL
jgi:hypothetical protein